MTYTYGQTKPLADRVAALHKEIRQLQQILAQQQAEADFKAALTIEQANTEVNRIIHAAIKAADDLRHQTERQCAAAKMVAENEANRIRERAYLEGRARADTHRIEHDHRMTGNQRRELLTRELRR